jgi:hypothetical protein
MCGALPSVALYAIMASCFGPKETLPFYLANQSAYQDNYV